MKKHVGKKLTKMRIGDMMYQQAIKNMLGADPVMSRMSRAKRLAPGFTKTKFILASCHVSKDASLITNTLCKTSRTILLSKTH